MMKLLWCNALLVLAVPGKFAEIRIPVLVASVFMVCLLAGIILICTYVTKIEQNVVHDYTDCENFDDPSVKCKDALKTKAESCFCYIPLNITRAIEAPVTVSYELESYEQFISNYWKSRDDEQLAGKLSLKPSASCGEYSYVGQKTIAPCGALADAMFNDTFGLLINNSYALKIYTGLISDKSGYHNPPGNLEQAFKDYAKPKNWVRNVWELDTQNPENNGFENENFIVWMKTDLKRKPVWRFNHTGGYEHGVPVGVYTLRVEYAYPTSRYDDRRLLIIGSTREYTSPLKLGFGIFLLLVAVGILIAGVIIICREYLNGKDGAPKFVFLCTVTE